MTATPRYDGDPFESGEPPDDGVAGLSTDWSVPWADLMMVLFVLFAILYCYELARRDIRETLAPPPRPAALPPEPFEPSGTPPPPEEILRESRRLIGESDLEHVDVEPLADGSIKVSVRGSAFFDLGSAELRPDTRAFLRDLAGVLRGHRAGIHVVGHTDSFPISNERYPTNWELSAARATGVARFLIEQGGIEAERFTVTGHSMYRPVVPNTTLENKSRNRRVEIVIHAARSEP